VLVIEDGHAASARLENLHDLFEELVTWIQRLTFFVLRVLAMLADDHDAVDRQPAGAHRQRFRDAREERHVETLRGSAGQVVLALGKLIDVHRHEIDLGPAPAAVPSVAEREAIEEMLGVRQRPDHRAEQSDLLARPGGRAQGETREGGRRRRRCEE
jgi:hypothetical protein